MQYTNNKTGLVIELSSLSDEEKRFYQRALKRFKKNTPGWPSMTLRLAWSAIYKRRKSHLDVLQDPLFLVLKEIPSMAAWRPAGTHCKKGQEPA